MPDIHVSRIDPHPSNIREELGDLTELRDSIRVHGILQPLVVERHPAKPGRYQILAGHRRLAAFKRVAANTPGLEMVPCVIRPPAQGSQSARALEVMLVENCQRRDLSPVEKAEAMGALRNHGLTAAAISRRTGISQSEVSRCLALLDLDNDTRARVAAGTVKAGAALRAVRKARKQNGGRSGRPVQAEPAWFTSRHRLAKAAAAMCSHTRRPLAGDVACGQCWEQAIRDDQDQAVPEPEALTAREERMQVIADLPMLGGPTADGEHVTARQAAQRVGVTKRTIERYKRDLAEAAAS